MYDRGSCMLNEKLLFYKNGDISTKKFRMNNMCLEYTLNRDKFDGHVIHDIIKFVNQVEIKYKSIKIPIVFQLGNINIEDKLTYIFFECICNYLICQSGRKVKVFCKPKRSIWTDGIGSSPLLLLNDVKFSNPEKFKNKFNKDIYRNHYRKIIRCEDENRYVLSETMDEIDYFLKTFDVGEESRKSIAEVVVELAGNAGEHAYSDCLIDLDVTEIYKKEGLDGEYYGINLVVMNFSDTLLGEGLKYKIISSDGKLNERHKEISRAYKIHQGWFKNDYCEEDFFNIASFQHKVSGRVDNSSTGGTGLTKLIVSLERRSDAHKCYVLTGTRGLWFNKEYLEYGNSWLGFNDVHDFFKAPPADDSLSCCPVYMPGTAYNLNFVLKREI